MSNNRQIFTYQTRIELTPEQEAVLGGYALAYGEAERSLFAAIQAGGSLNEMKREFQLRFGISARQFNAMRVEIEGKIKSIKERRPEMIAEVEKRIHKTEKVIAKLEKQSLDFNKLHQKKRRLMNLQCRLATLNADQEAGIVRICFGGKKLFHAQFNLEANNYADHSEWKADWCKARSSQFFVLGSQDETAGCQSCQASIAADGMLNLQLRLPNAMTTVGKHLIITGIRFEYGQEQIVAALSASQRIRSQTKDGKPTIKRIGSALSYRFVRDDKGWRIFVSVEARPVEQLSRKELGAIGIDVNVDHLAISETDRFGNLINVKRIDLVAYGKTEDQAKAIIGDAAVSIATQAKAVGKPVVIESLDFQKKKTELETCNPKQARLLSSFAYNKMTSAIKAAAFRNGVEVIEVNPAYTSVIGAVNFAQAKGISVHQGAAYAIARRGLGLSERPTVQNEAIVPTCNLFSALLGPDFTEFPDSAVFWAKISTPTRIRAHLALNPAQMQ
jgi:IS605 OrfB family transposase